MEKIKDALAKAKLQNTSGQVKAKTIENKAVPAFTNTENELGKINYLSTPVIKLDAVHLEKNRIIAQIQLFF